MYRVRSGRVEQHSLQEAAVQDQTCDVFVSHKKDDEADALHIAKCIDLYGLVPWVDVMDPSIEDGPELGNKIKDIITNSFSLLVVVSDVTKESWWVPFEIGIAFDQYCLLASYTLGLRQADLPSFLKKQPRLTRHEPDLHGWCDDIKAKKADGRLWGGRRLLLEGVFARSQEHVARVEDVRSTYMYEMKRMTQKYPMS